MSMQVHLPDHHSPASTASPATSPLAVDISKLLTTRDTLAGFTADLSASDDATRLDVLEKAFDFRGDVTLNLADGTTVEGYIFDRRKGVSLGQSIVRLLPPVGEQRVQISYADIRQIAFGRDTALGKSFETWIKKYVEKKLAGQKANLEAEALD